MEALLAAKPFDEMFQLYDRSKSNQKPAVTQADGISEAKVRWKLFVERAMAVPTGAPVPVRLLWPSVCAGPAHCGEMNRRYTDKQSLERRCVIT